MVLFPSRLRRQVNGEDYNFENVSCGTILYHEKLFVIYGLPRKGRPETPVVVGAALVIGGGTEVHGRGVKHVAIEVGQRAVIAPAVVPAQLRVAVQVAAKKPHALAADGRSIPAQCGYIAGFVRVARLRLDVVVGH